MKKFTLLLFSLFALCTYGQVSINETFDSGTPAGWTDSYANTTSQVCAGNSERDNLYSGSSSGNMTSPNQVGASNGTDVTFSIDYKVVDWSAATNPTADGWGTADLQYSTDDGSNWITAGTIDDSNDSNSNICTTFSVTILAASVPIGSDLRFRVLNTWAAGDYYFYIDNFVAEQVSLVPPNCDSTLTSATTDFGINDPITWSVATGIPTGYRVSIGTTMGGTDIANNVDVGNTTSYSPAGLSYGTTYYITITPYNANGDATGCTEESFATLTPISVDCSAMTPVNTTYCYGSLMTLQYLHTKSNDTTPLKLTFNAGGIESCCDEITIYDSDGTTVLYNGANGGDLTGVTATSTGDTIFLEVASDGSVDCASSSGCCTTQWDWDVECAGCESAVIASVNVLENCGVETTFDLEVNFTSLGDATFIAALVDPFPFFSIDYGPDMVSGTADDVLTYVLEDFPNGSAANFSVTHSDSVCNFNSANYQDSCPPVNDECIDAVALICDDPAITGTTLNGSGGSASSCDGTIGDDVWYQFTGNDSDVTVTVNTDGEGVQIGVFASTDGTCAGFTLGSCDYSEAGGSATESVTFPADIGTEYFIQIGNYIQGDPGFNFDISATCVPYPVDPPNCDSSLTSALTDFPVNGSLTWSDATGSPDGYKVSIGSSMGGTDIANAEDVGASTSYSPTGLAYASTYYVTITPYNFNGDATGCTEESFATEALPPAGYGL